MSVARTGARTGQGPPANLKHITVSKRPQPAGAQHKPPCPHAAHVNAPPCSGPRRPRRAVALPDHPFPSSFVCLHLPWYLQRACVSKYRSRLPQPRMM